MLMRGRKDKMCLLVAMKTTAASEKHLPAIEEATSESTECWKRVQCGSRPHWMNSLRLVIADSPGILREALNKVFAQSRLLRCWVYNERHITAT